MLHSGSAKDPPAKTGDVGSIPGSERCPGEGNGNPLHYSCLENSMDREAWFGYYPWVHKELDMTEHSTAQHGMGLGRVHNFMQNHKLPYLLFLQCPNSPTFLLLSPENTFLVNHWHSKFLAQNGHHRNLISNSWYMKQS